MTRRRRLRLGGVVGLLAISLAVSGCAGSSGSASSASGAPGPGPLASASPPPVSSQQRRTLVAFAKCMRRQGYREFTIPSFPAGGGVDGSGGGGRQPHYDKHSRAFRRAVTTCNTETDP